MVSRKSCVFRRLKLLQKLGKKLCLRLKKRVSLSVYRITWAGHLVQLREGEFKRRYHMSKEKFDLLLMQCQEVHEFFRPLTLHQQQHAEYWTESIESEHKMAVKLRWLSGGSYLDIHLCHGCSKGMVYTCV